MTVVVAADIAGYSNFTERDELKMNAALAALRRTVEALVAKHRGRMFNTAGDCFMLEFASSYDAVAAAIDVAGKCKPKVRVGVHLGDVAVQPNGDLIGHTVNVASRLMAKAQPGALLISADVHRTLHGPTADRFVSCGLHKLDKMTETIEAFTLSAKIGGSRRALGTKTNLANYARALRARTRDEWLVGQSEAIALGYESPLVRLPEYMKTLPREQAYAKSLQHLLRLDEGECKKLYESWFRQLSRVYRNDPNVALDGPLSSLTDVRKAYPTDFAIHRGLERRLHARPWSITGNVLAVTPDGRTALFLDRAKRISHDAPEEFHVIGGQMDPYFDLGSVAATATREFREESGRFCDVAGCPAILQREREFKYSMVTFLGVPVDHGGGYETEEGTVFPLDLMNPDSVANYFQNNKWVDSGWQAFLVWTAVGCPVRGAASPSITPAHARLLHDRSLSICRSRGLTGAPRRQRSRNA